MSSSLYIVVKARLHLLRLGIRVDPHLLLQHVQEFTTSLLVDLSCPRGSISRSLCVPGLLALSSSLHTSRRLRIFLARYRLVVCVLYPIFPSFGALCQHSHFLKTQNDFLARYRLRVSLFLISTLLLCAGGAGAPAGVAEVVAACSAACPALLPQARLLVGELRRLSLLWEEAWHTTLSDLQVHTLPSITLFHAMLSEHVAASSHVK